MSLLNDSWRKLRLLFEEEDEASSPETARDAAKGETGRGRVGQPAGQQQPQVPPARQHRPGVLIGIGRDDDF